MHRPPPSSTLFPYTTLFRSLFAALTRRGYTVLGPTVRDATIVYDEIESSSDLPIGWTDEDRKSTRLNSSHVEISYAVFCLKKKNIYHITSLSSQQAYRRSSV